MVSGYMFILIMAWTLRAGGHVKIDIVSTGLKPKVRYWMETILIPIIAMPFTVVTIWKSIEAAIFNTQLMEAATGPAQIPIWHMRWSIPVGFAILFIQLFAEWLRGIVFVKKGMFIEELEEVQDLVEGGTG